jgi:metallo-beta-lactamase family protein
MMTASVEVEGANMPTRRQFLAGSAAASLGIGAAAWKIGAAAARDPVIRFYGATRLVSGSCHILESSQGLFLVDCGAYMLDCGDPETWNREEFPFDARDVQAVFLTHAHADHNGRLPLLYARGFRGPVYCTDCTRDISRVTLKQSASFNDDDAEPLYSEDDVDGLMGLVEAVPYNTRIDRAGNSFRFTDAGHILGSAMVEVWVDGRKIIFGGDMGPMHSPIVCRPAQHFEADAVLVESTYGPVGQEPIDFEDFGRRINAVIARGGSVLLPSFAMHRTQTIIFILHKLVQDGIVPGDVPIISDSSTAHELTQIYDTYREYYDGEAKEFVGSLFYRGGYKEYGTGESLHRHESERPHEPAIYISTSGMLEHATSPKHLIRMADNPDNAVFLVGYQAPGSVGRRIMEGTRQVQLPWEEGFGTERTSVLHDVTLQLEVDNFTDFSAHARGQEILEWLGEFRELGQVFFVHGDAEQSAGMAEQARNMGLDAVAPSRGETFAIRGERVSPGESPVLAPRPERSYAPVEQ